MRSSYKVLYLEAAAAGRRFRVGLVVLVGTLWGVAGCTLSGSQANESNFRRIATRRVHKNDAITGCGSESTPISIRGLCTAINSSSINWKLVQKNSDA